jgi:oxygen-independent coproporphyrinogen-3 oxidase
MDLSPEICSSLCFFCHLHQDILNFVTVISPYSLYLHIPFCTHRCGYCDFNTYAGLENLIPAYVDALIREIRYVATTSGTRLPVHTIFFGGGTPSLLPVDQVADILDAIKQSYDLELNTEITLEANPGTLNLEKLQGLKQVGINRLSFGVQSANPEDLRLLERKHDFADVIQAVKWTRQAGFDNLNLDWIFSLPGQSLASWQRNIELATDLNTEHLSLYALSIEHGTPFKEMSSRGLMPLSDPDLAADMYEWASAQLSRAGFMQYEISNWAKPDLDGKPLACRHNLQYWRNLQYIGLGAGAHGYVGGMRIANTLAPAVYIKKLRNGGSFSWPRTPATATAEPVDSSREMDETMIMGLRLVDEGVSKDDFSQRFGAQLGTIYADQIKKLAVLNLLEDAGNSLRLTERGRLLGNQVFIEFV